MQLLKVSKFPFLISIFINAAALYVVLVFQTPVYKSVHDSYLALNSAGCYWEGINGNMHFHWGWFFLLGKLVKFIHLNFPGINGYSFVLYSYMFISATAVCNAFFRYLNFITAALVSFALLFVIYIPYYNLVIDFTNASIAMAFSAVLWLIISSANGEKSIARFSLPLLGMLFATLMRFHTAAVIMIAMLLLGLLILKKWHPFVLMVPAVIVIAWGIFQLHAAFQRNSFNNWDREQRYTAAVYSYINYPSKEAALNNDSLTLKMLQEGMYLDKNYLSEQRVQAFVKSGKYTFRKTYTISQLHSFKWFLINNKYMLLFYIFSLAFYMYSKRNYLPLLHLAGTLGAIVLARLLFKELNYLFIGVFAGSSIVLLFFALLEQEKQRPFHYIILALAVLGGLKYSGSVVRENKKFNAVSAEDMDFVRQHPEKKFISVMNGFDMDNIAANRSYAGIRLRNMLPMDIQLNWNEDTVYKQWQLSSIKEVINRDDIFFYGPKSDALHNLFVNIYKTGVTEIPDSTGHYYRLRALPPTY